MGNHEFCEECGASSFHYGQPCDPKRKTKYQKEQQEIRDREILARKAAKNLVKKLKDLGYEAELDHLGDVYISKFSLL